MEVKNNMLLQVQNHQFYLVADNGQRLQISPSFDKDKAVLSFLDGSTVDKIIKRQSKQTFKSKKDNKEKHYYNFYLITASNKSIQIKTFNNDDIRVLDALSDYIK